MTEATFQKAEQLIDDINRLEQTARENVCIKMALNRTPQIMNLRYIDEEAADKLVERILRDIDYTATSLKRAKIRDFEKLGV